MTNPIELTKAVDLVEEVQARVRASDSLVRVDEGAHKDRLVAQYTQTVLVAYLEMERKDNGKAEG